ncbi:hypothetical protein MOSE0_J09758 [Monosporozyma servazzii]
MRVDLPVKDLIRYTKMTLLSNVFFRITSSDKYHRGHLQSIRFINDLNRARFCIYCMVSVKWSDYKNQVKTYS